MSKWKDTSNHWSKTTKREEVLAKVKPFLQPDYWKGKKRDSNTLQKLQEGRLKYYNENKDTTHYKKMRQKVATAMLGNKYAEGTPSWNKGLKGYKAGSENNRWKGGVTPKNEKIRKSYEYKLWRRLVFTRDDYTCQACGQRGKELNADHDLPFALFPDLRFEVLNGQTLCKNCHIYKHKRTHGYYN